MASVSELTASGVAESEVDFLYLFQGKGCKAGQRPRERRPRTGDGRARAERGRGKKGQPRTRRDGRGRVSKRRGVFSKRVLKCAEARREKAA